MKIGKRYLVKILNAKKLYAKLKEIGILTYELDREGGFLIVKEPNKKTYEISEIKKGIAFTLSDPDINSGEDTDLGSYFEMGTRLYMYPFIDIHTHCGIYGSIVPSLIFDALYGNPKGDLNVLKTKRGDTRRVLGYDVKPIMGIAKARTPTKFDLLLIQEKTNKPLEISELLDVENAMKWYHESEKVQTLEESYQASQEVVEALKSTGFYNAELIRYRCRGTVKEDLEKLVVFEFNEVKLSSNRPYLPFFQ